MSEISKIARKGSGSACRSVFGGYVAWEMGQEADGSDSKAVEVAPLSHWPEMKAAILVVSADKKDTPSTSGMQTTVATSDLFHWRINSVVPKRFIEMKESILAKDFSKFGELTMKDSNSFHATCLDSYPPIFYMNDTSKKIIKIVDEINKQHNEIIAAYTYDAGPNAVIYYLEENEDKVLGSLYQIFSKVDGWNNKSFKDTAVNFSFDDELYKQVSRIILTKVGDGPQDTADCLVDAKGNPAFLA